MADRFHATVAPVVRRHEHHADHGPAGEPALPEGDPTLQSLASYQWTVPDGSYDSTPFEKGAELVGPQFWAMPDGQKVGYFPGYFGPSRPEDVPLIVAAVVQVEDPGFEWRVEDTQAGYVHVGFAVDEADAVADAKAWVSEQLAAPAPVEVPTMVIDLGEVFRVAGIDPEE